VVSARPVRHAPLPTGKGGSLAGEELELEVGPVAHGGSCVARHDGRVVFVRHALPGERVRAVVTSGRERDRFLRADVAEVLAASPDRVQPPCPWAGPGRCGGCDWQHATLPAQRGLKAAVVAEQMRRLAGLDLPVAVEAVPVPDRAGDDGLGWRTRVRLAVDGEGRAGLRRHRSHDVVLIDDCLISHPGTRVGEVVGRDWPGRDALEIAVSAAGERSVLPWPGVGETPRLTERAAGREWDVAATGFWQVHPAAADTLAAAVLDGLDPRPGERALDLYAGVGLFAGVLAPRLGSEGAVTAIEGSAQAVRDGVRNLRDLPTLRFEHGPVERVLPRLATERVDIVVLDPPRTGAGRRVVDALAALAPRAIAYVACDPAALARDVALLGGHVYRVASLRAFDLFPMTSHVECVAVLERSEPALTPA
jgi:tRNA/tmRNA/rRNA uracil-C5-methylase (TrmA/RlmC/RlmD family)